MKANIFQNSRFVYLDSSTELNNIKKNSHLRLNGKNYKIELYKKIDKNFDYQGIDEDIITLKRDATQYLIKGDIISVNTPVYSLSTIIYIKKSTSGFKTGDIIIEKSDRPFTLMVSAINDKGEIKSLQIQDEGYYESEPNIESLKYESSHGKPLDIELDLLFEESSYQSHEVIIQKINYSTTEVILNINAKIIPFNFKSKLLISKYCLVLSDEYLGDSNYGVDCEISSDFTPNLNIPYALQNSASMPDLYNEAIEKLDKEIQELKFAIKKLSER